MHGFWFIALALDISTYWPCLLHTSSMNIKRVCLESRHKLRVRKHILQMHKCTYSYKCKSNQIKLCDFSCRCNSQLSPIFHLRPFRLQFSMRNLALETEHRLSGSDFVLVYRALILTLGTKLMWVEIFKSKENSSFSILHTLLLSSTNHIFWDCRFSQTGC